jgi:SAM-dependent methyltransferase
MSLRERVLALPTAYRTFIRLIGGGYLRTYVDDYLQPRTNEQVLDVGCGPGDIFPFLPDVRYVGVDLSPDYIAAARKRYGTQGEFKCQDVADLAASEPGSFDLVMANGLLHHLDDNLVAHLMNIARQVLKPGGRLVTLDGCWLPGQSWVARYLLSKDRGQFVRDEASYLALARRSFGEVKGHIRHDLLRIPYTHIIMVCRKPLLPHGP